MSKQSESKKIQEYEAKPIFPMCSNCKWFKSDFIENEYGFQEEKNLRCGCELPNCGGFAVKKQGTCNVHLFKIKINE